MEFDDHPERPGWKVGRTVETIRGAPPQSPRQDMLSLYGCGPGEWEHRLYLVPSGTLIEDIVEFFEVGTRGALTHHWDERDTMDLVSDRLSEVDAVIPGSIELADPGNLRFRFWRKMRPDELDQIEAIYERVDEMQAGLQLYLNGASGESLLAEIMERGFLHLRWD